MGGDFHIDGKILKYKPFLEESTIMSLLAKEAVVSIEVSVFKKNSVFRLELFESTTLETICRFI